YDREREISFSASPDTWLMQVSEDGVIFNREAFPDATPDDFAEAVIQIIQNNFNVTFHKK
ncbi:MAG: hypothetical protein AABY22_01060, partial [Nanoarchaeota archaeon]